MGLGTVIMEQMLKRAGQLKAEKLELDAQCRAMGFYQKFGFEAVGDEHMDGTIPHKMCIRDSCQCTRWRGAAIPPIAGSRRLELPCRIPGHIPEWQSARCGKKNGMRPVSYTHLDVYKRQIIRRTTTTI